MGTKQEDIEEQVVKINQRRITEKLQKKWRRKKQIKIKEQSRKSGNISAS